MYSPLHTSFNVTFSTSKIFEFYTGALSGPVDRNVFSSFSADRGSLFGQAFSLLGGKHYRDVLLSEKVNGNVSAVGSFPGVESSWEGQGMRFLIRDWRALPGNVSSFFGSERASMDSYLLSGDVYFLSDGAISQESKGGHQLSVIEADRGTPAWVSGPLARGPT